MLFKPAIVVLTGVLQAAVLASASSTGLGQRADENPIEIEHGGANFRRGMKKHKKSTVNKDDEGGGFGSSIQEVANDELYVAAADAPELRRATADNWNHGSYAVTATRKSGYDGINIKIKLPDRTRPGDTLFLFLSRTDGLLPLSIRGWTKGAECFKSTNRQGKCLTEEHCIQRNGKYCLKFRRDGVTGTGKDLATVMFHKKVTSNQEPGCFTISLPGKTTTWGILTAIPSVNENRPILSFAGRSCDAAWKSVFPSVKGKANDVLLLSQSFDDTAARSDFLPPDGMTRLGFTTSIDEAGFLYGKKLDRAGNIGEKKTRGAGGPKCKDALLSVVVNRNS